VLVYALVSVAWIAFSDDVLLRLVGDNQELFRVISTAKGVLFVAASSSLIWVLLLMRDTRMARGRAEMEASGERYRMLAERAQDVVYRMRVAPDVRLEYISPSVTRITGHTPAEYYADQELVRRLTHPDDARMLPEASAAGATEPVTVRWVMDDGSVRWTEHRVSPVYDDSGLLVAAEGTARDITDRVRAEAARATLERAIDRSPVGLAILGSPALGFPITYANPAYTEILGLPLEQILGNAMDTFMRALGEARTLEVRDRVMRGETFELRLPILIRDGSPLEATYLVSPLQDANGEVEGVLLFLPDPADADARSRAESLLRAAMDASPLATVTMDLDGTVIGWNPAAEALFGWSAAETIGKLVPYLDEGGWEGGADRRQALVQGTAERFLVRAFRRADGTHIMCHLTTGVIRDASGVATGFVSLINDLTESLRREEWNNQLRRAIDHCAEAVVITDLSGAISYVNPAFETVSGYAAAELLGRNPRMLKSGMMPRSVYEDMWRRLGAGETWRGVLVNRRKDGTLYEEEATFSAVLGADGRPTAYVGVKRDLTLERHLSAGLNTEIMDRAAVQEAMARIEQAESAEGTAQVVCDVLAGFGDVEDVQLLYLPPDRSIVVPIACVATTVPVAIGQPIAATAAAYIRERAVGGPWADNHAQGRIDPRIDLPGLEGLVAVSAPIRHRGRTIGVLSAASRTATPDMWIARHTRIVSELATHAGPVVGPQLETQDLGAADVSELRRVIDGGAFTPVFQPICDLASRQPIGWEAFTRFSDGAAPAQRFADAKSMGLSEALELAAAQKAISAFAELNRPGWLSINVSPALVLAGQAPRITGVAGRTIVLELTEQVGIDDYARLRGAIDLLDPPALLAVDDTGTGYQSLRHVLELRPDFVKLDPSFVHEIDRDETRQAMVAGMVHYAGENNARLVAEGIETEQERRTLLRLGVRFGQGYLLGVPSANGAIAGARPASGPRSLRVLDDEEAADAGGG
jgi:PAS domain S-box-containing protein